MTASSGPPRIVVRCDASDTIGGGHAMRCLTLANALAGQGAKVTFAVAAMPTALEARIAGAGHRIERIAASGELQRQGSNWEEPPLGAEAQLADAEATGAAAGRSDWIIVDHYLLDARWHSAARAFADQILVIDDLANRSYDCDILLDQTFGRSAENYRQLVPSGARILAGTAYALLRPEFARERPAALERRREGGPVRRILVSMGTADLGGITARVVEQLLPVAPECAIDLVLGGQAASLGQMRELAARHPQISVHADSERMAELMRDADLAIGAAGTTSWERCCLGLPSITLVLAENQRTVGQALAASGAALVAANIEEIGAKLGQWMREPDSLACASAAAFAIADGLGTSRVLEKMHGGEDASGEVSVRPAALSDGGQLWLWRNDPVTRAQSRDSKPIGWKNHIKWLAAALDCPDRHLFIAERSGTPVGTIRFDRLEDGGHEVSIAIAPQWRGTGCGAALLRAGCSQMPAGTITASVSEDNWASRRLFESCGFKQIERAEAGFLRYLFHLNGGTETSRNKG